jgi:hypothetical protein
VLSAIGDRHRVLLVDIAQHPISTITQRYTRPGWNPKTGNALKDAVIKHGFAEFEVIPIPRGQVKLLTLTTAGEDVVRNAGIAITRSGRAGMEHEFWRQRLVERCERAGYQITHEYPLGNGQRVDLCAQRGNEQIFLEVETGKSDIIANIKTAMSSVDPTPFFQKYGENVWGGVKAYLDEVTDVAAAPVIKKYTGVLAAADVYTKSTTYWIMESLRLDLGLGSYVHP